MIAILDGYSIEIEESDYVTYIKNSSVKWSAYKQHGDQVYFVRTPCHNNTKTTEKLHRLIMGCVPNDGKIVDHKDGNTLNLKKENLRLCSRGQNSANSKVQINNVSGYKGVCYRKDKNRNQYQARIWIGGKNKSLGFYKNPEDAHRAYCEAARVQHGEFARFE